MSYSLRSLHLDGVIDDKVANEIATRLLYMDAEDNEAPIVLFLNTKGGSVTSGFAIYDAIQYISAPVWTVGVELVAGVGLLLLASGSPGNRFVCSGCSVVMTNVHGNDDTDIQKREARRIRDLIISTFCKDTGHSEDKVRQDMELERAFTPQQAVQYGFADRDIGVNSVIKLTRTLEP